MAPVLHEGTFYGGVRIDLDLGGAGQLLAGDESTEGDADVACRFFLDDRGHAFGTRNDDGALADVLASDELQQVLADRTAAFLTVGDHVVRLEPLGFAADSARWWSGVSVRRSEFAAAANAMLWQTLLLGLMTTFAAGLLIWFLAGRIAKPVARSADRMQDIADRGGDLTSEIEVLTNDEGGRVAKAFNAFQALLRDLLREVAGSSKSISSGTRGISEASQVEAGAARCDFLDRNNRRSRTVCRSPQHHFGERSVGQAVGGYVGRACR